MSRRVQADAKRLLLFFEHYSLSEFTSHSEQVINCKNLHKKLYGLMVFVAEFKERAKKNPEFDIFVRYLDEVISDALLSIFSWAQGAYKPAKLELRCVIENTLKALLSVNTPNIILNKQVYAIFEAAKNDQFFSVKFGTHILNELRNQYALLCGTVHSTPAGLSPLGALSHLPRYEEVQSLDYTTQFAKVLDNILAILYFNFYESVHNMHPENQQDILDSLSHSQKAKVHAEKFS